MRGRDEIRPQGEVLLMSRASFDQVRDGFLHNGFDYNVQAWVTNGRVKGCAHPESMREGGVPCCSAHVYAGQPIATVPGAERFRQEITRRT
jgi:hypothetical protein